MTFAVLAVLGFFLTMVLQTYTAAGPARPQHAAVDVTDVEQELNRLGGVHAAQVSSTIECIDDCTETSQNYSAVVELREDVTSEQISAIVSAHDAIAAPKLGRAAVPITLMVAPSETLSVAAVHYGFGITQAEAYLQAVQAAADVQVTYGPPSPGVSPLLSIEAAIPDLACSNADTAMAQVVPALGAAASAGGIPFSAVRFDCGSAALEAGIAAGAVYEPGWTQAATLVERVCHEIECDGTSGEIHDVSVLFGGAATRVVVQLSDGQELPASDIDTFQAVVDALKAAGAVNPQLDVNNY